MSRKTKRAQVEVPTNETAEKNQVEVTQADVQEVVPATIVEAGEAEIFPGQTEGHFSRIIFKSSFLSCGCSSAAVRYTM